MVARGGGFAEPLESVYPLVAAPEGDPGRPFGAAVIIRTLFQGFRFAPPLATIGRRSAATKPNSIRPNLCRYQWSSHRTPKDSRFVLVPGLRRLSRGHATQSKRLDDLLGKVNKLLYIKQHMGQVAPDL